MILDLIIIFVCALLTATVIGVLIRLANNYRAQQAFRKKINGIPFIPNASLFSGNAIELALSRRSWRHVDNMIKKYGSTFAAFYINKPVVVTCDLDFIKTFVIDEPNNHVNRIDLNIPSEEVSVDSIPFVEDDQWRRLRKAIAPAFSSHKIKSPNVQAELNLVISRLIESIENRISRSESDTGEASAIIDTEDMFHRYALALVLTCFYKQDKLINFDMTKKDSWVEVVDEGMRGLINPLVKLCIMFPIIKPALNWLMLHFHPHGKMRGEILSFVIEQAKVNLRARKFIADAKRQGKKIDDEDNLQFADGSKFRRNMIDYVIDEYHSGKMTQREFYHSSVFLFIAADKTSADALSRIIYNLAEYPDVQSKAREEVLKLGHDSDYLTWIINESMRLSPPAQIGCTRTITRDIKISSGAIVPAGTLALTPVWTIHRLKKYWGEDAEEFRPERWSESKNFHPVQFLAFGAGKRNCPGGKFAMHEMKTLLVNLLSRYKFDLTDQKNDGLHFSAPLFIFNCTEQPMYVKISRISKTST